MPEIRPDEHIHAPDTTDDGDPGNDRDLADKSHRRAKELNFQTGKLEPVADHVGDAIAPDDEDGEADGPDAPHVGAMPQSAADDPKEKDEKPAGLFVNPFAAPEKPKPDADPPRRTMQESTGVIVEDDDEKPKPRRKG